MKPSTPITCAGNSYVIRRALAEDVAAIVQLDPAQLLIVVADVANMVVGTLQLSFIPGLARRGALRAQIEAVRVAAQLRGRGVGAAMLGWAIAEAQCRDCMLV